MARRSEKAIQLIERIYDAALDPALWPAVLAEIADAVGGAQAIMGVHDFNRRGGLSVIAPRMNHDQLDEYRTHWGQSDILWQRTNRAPVGQVLLAERFVPREEFVRSSLYNEWHRKLRIGVAGIGVNLCKEGDVPVLCGIKRPSSNDEFDDDQIALFKLLAPHLVRAVELQRRQIRPRLLADAASTSVRPDLEGLILTDESCRIVHIDRDARKILDARDGLRAEKGKLAALDRSADAALRRRIGQCADSEAISEIEAGPLRIFRGESLPPHIVEIAPYVVRDSATDLDWFGVRRPVAVVMFANTDRERRDPWERLRRQFGLTATEADLAIEIAKGDGRHAAAERLGISVGTVRTHLSRIFDKTGVHRQAELVSFVLKLNDRH